MFDCVATIVSSSLAYVAIRMLDLVLAVPVVPAGRAAVRHFGGKPRVIERFREYTCILTYVISSGRPDMRRTRYAYRWS